MHLFSSLFLNGSPLSIITQKLGQNHCRLQIIAWFWLGVEIPSNRPLLAGVENRILNLFQMLTWNIKLMYWTTIRFNTEVYCSTSRAPRQVWKPRHRLLHHHLALKAWTRPLRIMRSWPFKPWAANAIWTSGSYLLLLSDTALTHWRGNIVYRINAVTRMDKPRSASTVLHILGKLQQPPYEFRGINFVLSSTGEKITWRHCIWISYDRNMTYTWIWAKHFKCFPYFDTKIGWLGFSFTWIGQRAGRLESSNSNR